MSTEVLLNEFKEYSEHPYRVLSQYKQEGKKVIGVLPYFAPVELVVAAGMVPMGIWGSNKKTIAMAKEYCATFYCTIAQLALEMLLDGTLDQLDGIITPTICDTLRPMSQNYRVAMEGKLPCIFLAHPQNRKPAFGLQFTVDQYMHVKGELEKIAGKTITDDDLRAAIKVMNRNRAARRAFVKLASEHCDVISAVKRSAVLARRRLEGLQDRHLRHHLRQPQAAADLRRQQDCHCRRRRGPGEPLLPGGRQRGGRSHDGPGSAVCRPGLRRAPVR